MHFSLIGKIFAVNVSIRCLKQSLKLSINSQNTRKQFCCWSMYTMTAKERIDFSENVYQLHTLDPIKQNSVDRWSDVHSKTFIKLTSKAKNKQFSDSLEHRPFPEEDNAQSVENLSKPVQETRWGDGPVLVERNFNKQICV